MIVRILEFRERLRKLYSKTDRYLLAVGKFLVALVGQLEIFYLFAPEQSGIGMLLVQIGLALVCAWFPAGLLTFVYGGTILYTLYGLNVEAFLGAALLIFVLILVLWTVHPGYTWLIALAFLLGLWKVPQPLILLAAMWYTPFVLLPMAAGMVLCGYVHYVATNLYLYQESTLSLKLLLQILEGGLGNIQVYIGILEVALTFLVVYLLRKKEFHHSRPISVFTGGMAYLLIQLMHQLVWEGRGLVLGTELWTTIGSTIVVLLFVIFGYAGDYTRVEYAQFEDDDYYYYVKAVPKISIPEADTKVKTFSSVQQTTEEIPEVIVTDAEGQEGEETVVTMSDFIQVLKKFFGLSIPRLEWNDVLEILLLAVMIYYVILWIKRNRAWTLLKGIAMLVVFSVAAYVLRLTTISWILSKLLNAGLLAILILFQPELRKALEELGRKNPIGNWFNLDESRVVDKSFSNETIDAIVKATFDMGKVKTGALIVIEQEYDLTDYIKTGIELDAMISSQLLVQIFEHNTPLHDGAAIIRGNRIVSATCYLPLSNNMDISKELGTRHRAGLGISEVTDSVTIIASEETGKISLAVGGQLSRDLDAEAIWDYLKTLQKTPSDSHRLKLWKGRQKDEKKSD